MFNKLIKIGDTTVGDKHVYIVAEMSANHLQEYDKAIEIVHAAKEAGADAIKLQTYKPDLITIDSDNDYFQISGGTIWDGETLYKLYEKAYTPWEWQPKIMEEANKLGMDCFSSPFDFSAVSFMEEMNMPAFKIASYEITDISLIKRCASTKKPIIIATGVARKEDIELALCACKEEGNNDVILLKCVSAYPTPYEEVNLRMMTSLAKEYGCIVGLSDHTMGSVVPIGAVALGAKMVEKHLTLKRSDGGPDGAFSMEPDEFSDMVKAIRVIEKALGKEEYSLTETQEKEREGARSLFVVKDIKRGEELTQDNIKSIRPGNGLPPKEIGNVLGKHAARDLYRGTPLCYEDFK
ncbi:MAG: pseudaminic acid synthase [Lachnospiraceae bacterium]|nr:pseudaminic acid synthase [Lachnospiraceae bacterium]